MKLTEELLKEMEKKKELYGDGIIGDHLRQSLKFFAVHLMSGFNYILKEF